MDDFIGKSEVCVPGLVPAELIQGAKSEREIEIIKDMLDSFTILEPNEDRDAWIRAGRLSHEIRKSGTAVHLADCLIAVIAKDNPCRIATRDGHFRIIEKKFGTEVILL